MSTNSIRKSNWHVIWEKVQHFGSLLIVAGIAFMGFWGGHFLLPGGHDPEEAPSAAEAESEGETLESIVVLPPRKREAGKIETAQVTESKFQQHKLVPGRIDFDETEKVDLRATVDCIVQETLVRPSETVKQGQPLLVLSGPRIGEIRAEMELKRAAAEIAQRELDWAQETHRNVQELIEFLETTPNQEEIESRFGEKRLGEHGEEILAAFNEWQLAQKMSDRIGRLKNQGAIAGKTADERESQLAIAAARYHSTRQKLQFQLNQVLRKLEADYQAATQQLAVFEQKLDAMLGPNGRFGRVEDQDDSREQSVTSITSFTLQAPRKGVVVMLPAVQSARFEPGEVLISIANTSQLWIEARVSQQDWDEVDFDPQSDLEVIIPSLGNQTMAAKPLHLAAEVSPITMAIPLVASLENSSGRLRAGMAAWVQLPVGQPHLAITVPEAAVQRNGEDTFVFVERSAATGTYQKQDIRIGGVSDGLVEVLEGLAPGQPVVVQGAFFLKSEWLLAGESEE